jgi:hypothetical protein
MDGSETGGAGPLNHSKKKGFGLIVSRMTNGNTCTASLAGRVFQESIASQSSRLFQGAPLSPGLCSDV